MGWRTLCARPIGLHKEFPAMKRFMTLALGCYVLTAPLYAALQPGAQAPNFTTQATLAGKPFTFSLADALKSGPVVL